MQPQLPNTQPAPLEPSVPQAAPTTAVSPVAGTLPSTADDNDVIEKEWVAQVQQVVAKTAHDPYELNKQFTQIKAEYMQKRYGTVLKVED